MNKHARALFRTRSLCDSGLRSQVVIPPLMDELRHLVPFGAWVFAWSNAQGQLVNSATSPLRPESIGYMVEHFPNFERDIGFSVHEAMRTFPAVSNPWHTGRVNPRMEETESYRMIWGPEGIYFNLTIAIRDACEAPLGLIQLFRPKTDVDFRPADEDALRTVLPYLRRLLEAEILRDGDTLLAEDGRPGVAVFRDDRGPLFISERAFALSTMAFNDELAISVRGLQLLDPADRLREMHREVRAAESGMPGVAGPASRLRTRSNQWGTFDFEWELSRPSQIETWSVVVRHRIPIQLRLLRMPEGASLSARQLEVCRGLLEGETTPLIAQRIGVKRTTLKDHTREIYRKFGVRDRDGLLRKVMETDRRTT